MGILESIGNWIGAHALFAFLNGFTWFLVFHPFAIVTGLDGAGKKKEKKAVNSNN